jgi:hypothetical protein
MSQPVLSPSSTTSKVILPVRGDVANVSGSLPYGIYLETEEFKNGAADQVSYTYKKLGGDVLDIELTEHNVYASYEEAVLEYSYLVNLHQAKNALGNMLGDTTASFDEDGEIKVGDSLENTNVALKYPRFTFQYAQKAAAGIAAEAYVGGELTEYSCSVTLENDKQVYDLQDIISASASLGQIPIESDDSVGMNKITIRKVYYVSPRAMWRFFAYYGGLNVIGNMTTYGQYADDTSFEVVPAWQNKLQAMAYEDSIYTRISHYSYEIHNNKLRLYPTPDGNYPNKLWVRFTVQKNSWEETTDRKTGADGVNNMNTLPFANIPYENINSIGKHWIRRFALALSKETLGQIRGKIATIPIPGESITLNAAELLSQSRDEQDKLREELKTILDELTYEKLVERDSAIAENTTKMMSQVPYPIYVG